MAEITRLGVFLPLLESHFEVEGIPDLSLQLISGNPVQDPFSGAVVDAHSAACFSLIFKGPVGATLLQGLYPLRHPEFGHFDMFLVPVGCSDGQFEMEAVFMQATNN